MSRPDSPPPSDASGRAEPEPGAASCPSGGWRRTLWIAAGALALAATAFGLSRLLREDPLEAPRDRIAGLSSRDGAPAVDSGRLPLLSGPTWDAIDDPHRDGWTAEVVHARVSAQLEALGSHIVRGAPVELAGVERLAARGVACDRLVPVGLVRVFEDGLLAVDRWERPEEGQDAEELSHKGAVGLRDALEGLAGFFVSGGAVSAGARFKSKVFRIDLAAGGATTRQYVSVSGSCAAGFREVNAIWSATWSMAVAEEPLLRSLRLEDYEQVTRKSRSPLLSDTTESVLGANPSFREQLLRGLDHWLERLQDNRFFALLGTPALALADVDGDGLEDLYLGQEGGLPNRLFLQQEDGSAADASAGSGADWLESTRGVLLVDLDNDGDQDLAAAVLGALAIASGDGGGRFELRAALPTSHDTMSLAAADYDNDGDADIYVTAYKADDLAHDAGAVSIGASSTFVYHDANNAAANILFRNEATPATGPWKFADVTRQAGLDANNRRFSFSAAWEDFDADGDQDLYVANDFGRNNLYRNLLSETGEPRFRDIAGQAEAEDSASGMSVSWADYDRDGRIDLYVSNMFSAAGGRITRQELFKPEAPQHVRERLQRFARGNTLLQGLPGGSFRDASESARVTMGRWAWSSNFADINNDGWEDILVANGYITTEESGDL